MTRYYATTDYDGCPYITAGKRYEIRDASTSAFWIDADDKRVCGLFRGCIHLNGNNWKIGIIREDK